MRLVVLAVLLSGVAWSSDLAWNLEALQAPPRVHEAALVEEGVRGIFYEGLPWQGRETRVFAWVGLPEREEGQKVPGMVLVHGGGGTAYAEWVRIWNARGYAAIAMDLEGGLPAVGEAPREATHAWSGPARAGRFADLLEPVTEQWYYHAVADVILAHSLLRSYPAVDAERIGLTGISWGGILSGTVSGVDSRFKFVIPVYGCGFLNEAPLFKTSMTSLNVDLSARWMAQWDPSGYLPRAAMPMLWVNGPNDQHFPLDVHARSVALPRGTQWLSVRVGLLHSHHHGWAPEEIYAFADYMNGRGEPMVRVLTTRVEEGKAFVEYTTEVPVVQAELVTCSATDELAACEWQVSPAAITESGYAEAPLPAAGTAYFFNLTDTRGYVASSPLEYATAPAAPVSAAPAPDSAPAATGN